MVLSIPVHTVFLNFCFFRLISRSSILQNNDVLRRPGIPTMDVRFDWICCDQEIMQDLHAHTYWSTHTHTHSTDEPRGQWFTCRVHCDLRTVGHRMLLDNGWLSHTATVRGQTHGPIRIYPTSLRCCRNDTGYHVKGHLTHTQYTHLGPFSSQFLTGNYAYSSQPIFHSSVRGDCFSTSYWLTHTGQRVSKPVECFLRKTMADDSFMFLFFYIYIYILWSFAQF